MVSSYPSLSSAITALLNSDSNLMDTNNTITFLESCVKVTQYFPNNTQMGPSANGEGTISISYVNTPAKVANETAITDQKYMQPAPYCCSCRQFLNKYEKSG